MRAGDEIGTVSILNGEQVVQQISVTAPEDVPRISVTELWKTILGAL